MRGFTEEVNRRNQEKRVEGAAWQTELGKVNKAIAAIMTAIEDGFYNPEMKGRMNDLQAQKLDLQNRLATDARAKVEALTQALSVPNEREKAAEAIRALIDRIVITPTEEPAGVTASIHGDLAQILVWLGERCKQTKTPLAFASGSVL